MQGIMGIGVRLISQCIRQIKVSFLTIFECGFSGITAWLTVKVSQTYDLPVLLNTNPPCRPDCVVCLSLYVTSSMPCTPPPCSLSSMSVYTLQCQHRRNSMATHTATRESEQGPSASTRVLQLVLEKRFGRLCPTVRGKYAFDVVSQLTFYGTAGVKTG